MIDLLSESLDLLAALGAWSVDALWLPLAVWTLAACVALALLHVWPPHPLVGYRVRQALLFALPAGLGLAAVTNWSLPLLPAVPVPAPTTFPQQALPPVTSTPVPVAPVSAAPPALPSLTWTHALGVLTLVAALLAFWQLARLGVSAVRLRRRRRAFSESTPAQRQAARKVAERLGMRRRFRLACAPSNSVPMTLGAWPPVVAVPPGLDGERLDMALAHELVHLRRRDDVAAWGEAFIRTLFFVHPLCALLARRIATDREAACDAAVLTEHPFSPRRYAQMLLDLAAPVTASQKAASPLALSLAAPRQSLPHRLHAMKNAAPASRFALLLPLALLLAPLALMACADLSAPAAPEAKSQEEVPSRMSQLVENIEVRKHNDGRASNLQIMFKADASEAEKQHLLRQFSKGGNIAHFTEDGVLEVTLNEESYFARSNSAPLHTYSLAFRTDQTPSLDLDGNLSDAVQSISVRQQPEGPGEVIIVLKPGTPQATRDALRDRFEKRPGAPEVTITAGEKARLPEYDNHNPSNTPRGLQAGAAPAPRRVAAADTIVPYAVAEAKPELIGERLRSRIEYPEFAKRNGIQGTVFLQFIVGPRGEVRDIEVLRSPSDVLTEEAVRILEAASFEPGRHEGRAVSIRMSLPVRFSL